ncbi:MAG: bis(5'-nucleosyl)-tetraphosphatase (symmetrical) YqeK [Erysipelotrichaceae bacterium]|jgi:nicotinate-nucleotide adenylyltransferase|nr:bis(5'-nucleosyl)-tetraphosphatase (symmetrical) YqeK [Erysipelotrichaceae bacterium]
MNPEELNFDDFMKLDHKMRKRILNDPELLKPMIRKNMKRSRYEHSLSVADVCADLASYHHVDRKKAYMAGLLHDVCKFPDDHESQVLRDLLKAYDPDKLNGITGAYHSWAAKYYLKEKTNFHDKDILNAVYNHTICASKDKLSLILYIADKREPLRGIDDDILEIAKKDLKKAYQMLSQDVERYIKEVKNERFVENSL